jgi:hypothetical protein
MTRCAKCKELIGGSSPSYKASRGFVGADGIFHDDEAIIVHIDCLGHYTFDPFAVLEDIIKNG